MKVKYIPICVDDDVSLLTQDGCLFATEIEDGVKALAGENVDLCVRTNRGVQYFPDTVFTKELSEEVIREAKNMLDIAATYNAYYQTIEQDEGTVSNPRIAVYQPVDYSMSVVDLKDMEMYTTTNVAVINKVRSYIDKDATEEVLDALMKEVKA